MNYTNCIISAVNSQKHRKEFIKFENQTQQKPERICTHKGTKIQPNQQKTR
jgi:hypothetical protein